MELNVYGRNVKVPERLSDYIEEKVQKFEQLNDRVESIDVKVAKVGHGPQSMTVEITVNGPGPVLRAEAQGMDKFAVFDDAYGKLLERLRRARDRRKIHRGHARPESVAQATGNLPVVPADEASQRILLEEAAVPVEEAAFDTSISLEEEASPVEIRRKVFPTQKLTAQQAVDHMEMVGHDFYLFIDEDLGEPAVAYRRKGWSYGVIVLSDEAHSDGEKETLAYSR